ncbi:MAG: hypothetical protein IPM80_13290 [Proteobacteria bacterium]|nr:hypothetical protein [Pseudomonadota bacterium]
MADASSAVPPRPAFPARIAYFITGHGHGHAARSARLINQFPAGTTVTLFTTIEPAFFARTLTAPFGIERCEIDCGCVQRDAADIDVAATLARYSEINEQRAALLEHYAARLRALAIDVVIADIPPLAFAIARAAGVPAVGISNFTWAEIYADYLDQAPWFAAHLDSIRADYARADVYLRLYPHIDEQPCARVRDVGLLLGTDPVRARHEVAQVLNLDASRPWCLVYFGASGLRACQWSALDTYPQWSFIGLYALPGAGSNYRQISLSPQISHGDVVAGASAVLGKLGYGLVSECLALGKPVVFPHRHQFREFPALRDSLLARDLGFEITSADLGAGRLDAALQWCSTREQAVMAPAERGDNAILHTIAEVWRNAAARL